MKKQTAFFEYACRALPPEILRSIEGKKIFAVCDRALLGQNAVCELIKSIGCEAVFSDFTANPDFGSVKAAVKLFDEKGCGAVVAVGGGSTMDIAKCVKFYAGSPAEEPFPTAAPKENNITVIAFPTTAGTGSEATRFAVVYYRGEKQSIEHESLVPQYVVFDASLTESLPLYHRASTACDALCHAVESLWSVNSSVQSREYALESLSLFFDNYEGYLNNDRDSNEKMLACANLSGRAINISKTTAAHAMSYKLTSLKGIAHGHAAMLCLPPVMRYIAQNTALCIDKRGESFLHEVLDELCLAFKCRSIGECAAKLEKMTADLFGKSDLSFTADELSLLASSVNLQRLANSPVPLNSAAVRKCYIEVSSFCERNGG